MYKGIATHYHQHCKQYGSFRTSVTLNKASLYVISFIALKMYERCIRTKNYKSHHFNSAWYGSWKWNKNHFSYFGCRGRNEKGRWKEWEREGEKGKRKKVEEGNVAGWTSLLFYSTHKPNFLALLFLLPRNFKK